MLETKLFEIRDRMTMIVACGVRMVAPRTMGNGEIMAEQFLLRHAGYPTIETLIFLSQIAGDGLNRGTCDPYSWGGRTMPVAHQYIQEHWRELKSGSVIDVQFILGETEKPCMTEMLSLYNSGTAPDFSLATINGKENHEKSD